MNDIPKPAKSWIDFDEIVKEFTGIKRLLTDKGILKEAETPYEAIQRLVADK